MEFISLLNDILLLHHIFIHYLKKRLEFSMLDGVEMDELISSALLSALLEFEARQSSQSNSSGNNI